MISMVLVTGIISSLGLIATNVLRYMLIIRECKVSSYYPSAFEVSVYLIIDILRLLFYIQFAWDAGFRGILTLWCCDTCSDASGKLCCCDTFKCSDALGKCKALCHKNEFVLLSFAMKTKDKKCFWPFLASGLLFITAFLGSVGSGVLSYHRDRKFVTMYCHKVNADYEIMISYGHAIAMGLAYFSTMIICFCSIKIFYSSICKWKEGTNDMKIRQDEWILRYDEPQSKEIVNQDSTVQHDEPITQSEEIVNQDSTMQHQGLDELLEDKLYSLYNNYMEVGRKTSLERNALRKWFVLMYFTYLAYVLIHFVHVMKLITDGLQGNDHDISSSMVNIILHFIAFFFPCCMGTVINSAHHDYHQKLIDTYLGVKILIDEVYYLCKQGNFIKLCEKKTEETVNEFKLQDINNPITWEKVEKIYKKYFKKARKVEMAKNDEFDFVPSFLSITIPFDSYGYTFAVLLTAVSIILSFLHA